MFDEHIVGGKFFGHDAGFVILEPDNQNIFGCLQERFTRIKHDASHIKFHLSMEKYENIAHCFLNEDTEQYQYNIRYSILLYLFCKKFKVNQISALKKLEKQLVHFVQGYDRAAVTSLARVDQSNFFYHHLCHSYYAYFFSPFFQDESISIVIDGEGDDSHAAVFTHKGDIATCINTSKLLFSEEQDDFYPGVGGVYSFLTEYIGYFPNADEGKLEALASYGKVEPNFLVFLESLFYISTTTEIKINADTIKNIHNNLFLSALLDGLSNEDIACTTQVWLEQFMIKYICKIKSLFPQVKNICFSGGVFHNVSLNRKIFESNVFQNIYIPPLQGDEGAIVGSALLLAQKRGHSLAYLYAYYMPYWGHTFGNEDVIGVLEKFSDYIVYSKIDQEEELQNDILQSILDQKIVGIFRGKGEYGRRALGNRSILASPYSLKIKDRLNYIKKREPFQPLCPSILEVERTKLFPVSYSNKFMSCAFYMKQKYHDLFPGIIHHDGTSRCQFVEKEDNAFFYNLLLKYKQLTGWGVLINTSLNIHGKTMVRTPDDAIEDFLLMDLDKIYIENYLIEKKDKGQV